MFRRDRNASPTSGTTVIVVVVVVLLILLAGRISCELTADSLTVGAPLSGSVTVQQEDMEAVQLLTDFDSGTRSRGVSSFWTESGRYKNEVYGSYRLYRYNSVGCVIELGHSGGEILVFNLTTEEETEALFAQLEAMLQ